MRLALLIAAVSAAVLGYEVALMRGFAVAGWHHFAYMIVSVALLGFGASGTLLSLCSRRLLRRFEGSMLAFATAFALSIPLSFALAQRVPFDLFQLVWDPWQYVYLLEYYLLLFVPFLLGATCIGLAFVREAHGVHRLYFWNLLGSGVGACAMVGLMFIVFPARLPLGAMAVAGLGVLVYMGGRSRLAGPVAFALLYAATVYFAVLDPLELDISEHKSLNQMLDAGAHVVERRTGPLGTVHVLEGPTLRLVAGRSLLYMGEEPEQRAILVDAGGPSAINRLEKPELARNFDYTSRALPYHLLGRPSTLIIGAGGGSDVVLARYHDAQPITALELNPVVADLMRGSQARFARHIYQQPGVELEVAEARGFLARTRRRYDLIQLPLVESFGAASAGAHALSENYLYTVEAFDSYLDHLTDRGMVSVTRWLNLALPADPIRIFATLGEALRRRGVDDVASHLAFVRAGWSTATIVASRQPLTEAQVGAIRRFCEERSFDLVWVPGMEPQEANRHHKLPDPVYARTARELLSDERREFIDAYPLDITPTTDDRPYHALSVRGRALRGVLAEPTKARLSMIEWGYVVLLATLAQAAVVGGVLILLPLALLRRRRERRGGWLATWLYFGCLGMAFMFIEIVMMQKLTLFLASPIYAAALVLATFMVFSGLGSRAAGRLLDGEHRTARLGVAGVVVVGLALWLGMDPLLGSLWGSAAWLRVLVATGCSGALAFFMGMPFPSGLRRAARQVPGLVPWAWGVNGCASVVGAVLAMVLAVSLGFRAVLLVAFGLYVLAGLVICEVRGLERP
ncbi:MAG: spermidine synthase [Candidatus Brocadiia bacterium]